jgi:hypothetical protein
MHRSGRVTDLRFPLPGSPLAAGACADCGMRAHFIHVRLCDSCLELRAA